VLQQIQSFVVDISKTNTSTSKQSTTSFAVAVRLPQFEFKFREPSLQVTGKEISFKQFDLKCASLSLQVASGITASILGFESNFESDLRVKINTIASLVIPEVIKLKAPVNNTSIIYRSEGVPIKMNSLFGIFEHPKSHQTRNEANNSKISIPIPIQLDLKSLKLEDAGGTLFITLNNIDLSAKELGAVFLLKSHRSIKLRWNRSPEEYVDAKMGKLSLHLHQDNGRLKPKQIEFSGAVLGP